MKYPRKLPHKTRLPDYEARKSRSADVDRQTEEGEEELELRHAHYWIPNFFIFCENLDHRSR